MIERFERIDLVKTGIIILCSTIYSMARPYSKMMRPVIENQKSIWRNIMKILLVITLVLCLLCTTVYAETYLFAGTYFPYIVEEKSDGVIQGVGVEIAKEIVEGLGHTIQIRLYPWARAQRMIKDGKADVLIGPYKTPEREKFMDYTSHHFYVDRIVFYAKSDRTLVWNGDFSSLQGKVIGTTLGWSYGTTFDQMKESLTLESVNDLCTNFKKLVMGRVYLVPATNRNALVCIEELDIRGEVTLLSPDIQTTKGYYGFSRQKNLTHFKEQFEEKLQQMIKNGAVSRINQTYHLRY